MFKEQAKGIEIWNVVQTMGHQLRWAFRQDVGVFVCGYDLEFYSLHW